MHEQMLPLLGDGSIRLYRRCMKRQLLFRSGLGLLACAVLSSGCATRLGDLTILSTKNVASVANVVERGVEGRDCISMLLFIPISGRLNPTIDEAMDDAMSRVPKGNIMTDVALYADLLFTFVYNRACYRVKGDVGVAR